MNILSVALTLSLLDTHLRYRRTTLGPFWVTISFAAFVLAVGMVYGQLFGMPEGVGPGGYIAYFAVGMLVWTFLNATISEGCTVFIQAGGLIKSVRLPVIIHVYRMVARNTILMAHNAAVIVVLWLAIQWPIGWGTLLALVGLTLCLCTLLGVVLVVAVFCTRFRDLQQVVVTLLQLTFLVTPIIWPASFIKGQPVQIMLDLNPVYYIIEVVRGPLIGEVPSATVWIVAGLIASTSSALGLALYRRFQRRLVYWL